MLRDEIFTTKVRTAADRAAALAVVEEVYRLEKRWIRNAEAEISTACADDARVSWFLIRVAGEAAGVIRLVYDPALTLPADFEPQIERPLDLEAIARHCRFVDIGRFMILPRYRHRVRVVLKLMRAALAEVVERGYTHFITDVFESDPHSPLKFHTRVLGFERVGTHRHGELACESVRIILVLDIARTYERMKRRRDRVYRELTLGIRDHLDRAFLPVIALAG